MKLEQVNLVVLGKESTPSPSISRQRILSSNYAYGTTLNYLKYYITISRKIQKYKPTNESEVKVMVLMCK